MSLVGSAEPVPAEEAEHVVRGDHRSAARAALPGSRRLRHRYRRDRLGRGGDLSGRARRARAARRCGMNATTPARTRMNKARYKRFEARSWYRTNRKSGTLDRLTSFSEDS